MRRGQVWWAALPDPQGVRPVLLLSRDKALQLRNAVTVAPLTSTIRSIPTEVALGPTDGVPKSCAVNLDSLQTISKSRLMNLICPLSPVKMAEVGVAVRFALDI